MNQNFDQLQKALIAFDSSYKSSLADVGTEIELYPTSLFPGYHVYWIIFNTTYHSTAIFVAFAPEKQVYVISRPEQLYQLNQAVGLFLSDSQTAVTYLKLYLTVTQMRIGPSSLISYVVSSVDDFLFSSQATEEKKAQIHEQLQSVITPPQAQQIPEGFSITLYGALQKTLKRYVFKVDSHGQILEQQAEIVQEKLPLVYLV